MAEGVAAGDDGHRHHAIDYVEIAVTDIEAAKAFYTAAFGWVFQDYGPAYAGFRGSPGGPEMGGLTVSTDVRAGGPLVLLYSEDLDRTAAAVTAAGGRVLVEPYTFPGGRRFHFADPSGNEVGVWAAT
ncbi:VOC family protein [Georgenia yuyongxinii]|uniref:VOC family protein n=1 Tax=Georgenia yuyongxinii TaxID=2589797 RepID=A0A5B8C3W8_9MICO|nr:VOC family protein [Georgenia yuyongxinii]QDC25254.1 VOC family protein [Georgenia yuyongxinii]